VGAGQDLGEVGEVLRLLFPDDIGGDPGKGAGDRRWGLAVGTGRFAAAVFFASGWVRIRLRLRLS
jgi:hypothetical protein